MSHHLADQPATPDDNAPVSPGHRSTWWTVRTVRYIAFLCVGLAVALSLVSTLVVWHSAVAANDRAVEVEQRLTALEEFVQGRGEYRDQETQRLEQGIDQAVCDVLQQFPAGPLLDEVRAKYGCGPGRPREDFPPEVQAELRPRAGTQVGPSSSPRERAEAPPQPRTPHTPRPTPAPSSPAAESSAASTPPPPGGVPNPLTDPVCRLLGVCL